MTQYAKTGTQVSMVSVNATAVGTDIEIKRWDVENCARRMLLIASAAQKATVHTKRLRRTCICAHYTAGNV